MTCTRVGYETELASHAIIEWMDGQQRLTARERMVLDGLAQGLPLRSDASGCVWLGQQRIQAEVIRSLLHAGLVATRSTALPVTSKHNGFVLTDRGRGLARTQSDP